MRRVGTILAVLLSLPAALCLAAPQATVTTATLLEEMTDLPGLAEFPDPPFTCRQFSSYDRKSKSPEEGWFANGDRGHYLRAEERDGRKEYVMMDAAGPGAIVRIWSANPRGTLRIYLDGGEVPAIEAPMTDLLGGKLAGIPSPIAGERSRGWNCYLPIPYAKHCKVTSDEGNFYYHVNYRTYAKGTWVVTFRPSDLETSAPAIAEVAKRLTSPRGSPAGRVVERDLVIPPGKALLVERAGSPGAVIGLRCRVLAESIEEALRTLVLRIRFDGEETVASPLGDFFGAAPGINPYASLPMGVTREGEFWCQWVMPFRESLGLEIRNEGKKPATVDLRLTTSDYEWTDRSLHFHGKWRTEFDVPTRPMRDWSYLRASGRGVFVGAAFSIANPVKNWWGEGDEKIYVDGETFPSHFGTGTEDYYGYAWCSNETFTHAYHNQPRCDGPRNYGHTSVNRWHIIDRIPFEKDFRFDMELWHWRKECEVTMSVVSYWYARPGATDGFEPIEPADLRLTVLPEYVVPKVEGAIEGEKMKVITKSATVGPQEIGACSGENHMWWRGEIAPGDRLVLGFPVDVAGRYRVLARFVKAADYAVVRMSVNGGRSAGPIDLYHDGVVVSKEIDLGVFELSGGENRIGVEIVGANEKAVPRRFFGLDYLRLVPAK